MKIGIVKHLNARPLTYGFEKFGIHPVFSESPAVLKDMLLRGELDTALISSIEVLRNKETLGFSDKFGVCAEKKVRSILFFKNKSENFPPKEVFVDSGSRSSVALLKLLLKLQTGWDIIMTPRDPEEIAEGLLKNNGSHLLFGDNALLTGSKPEFFEVIDLASWWNQVTGFSFCFAFWAYPKNSPLPDEFFGESLEYGLRNINEIISQEKRFSPSLVSDYLNKDLHYVLSESDRKGFSLFEEKCEEYGYL